MKVCWRSNSINRLHSKHSFITLPVALNSHIWSVWTLMYKEKVSMCFVIGLNSYQIWSARYNSSHCHFLSTWNFITYLWGLQISIYRSKEEQGQKRGNLTFLNVHQKVKMADHVIQTLHSVKLLRMHLEKLCSYWYIFAILVISLDWGYKANPPWRSLGGTLSPPLADLPATNKAHCHQCVSDHTDHWFKHTFI